MGPAILRAEMTDVVPLAAGLPAVGSGDSELDDVERLRRDSARSRPSRSSTKSTARGSQLLGRQTSPASDGSATPQSAQPAIRSAGPDVAISAVMGCSAASLHSGSISAIRASGTRYRSPGEKPPPCQRKAELPSHETRMGDAAPAPRGPSSQGVAGAHTSLPHNVSPGSTTVTFAQTWAPNALPAGFCSRQYAV